MKKCILTLFVSCFFQQSVNSQIRDSVKFDYDKIYSYALDGNIPPAFPLLEVKEGKIISKKDSSFKHEFENRFKYKSDKSNYLSEKKSVIDNLLLIFRDYWRESILDSKNNYDSLFIERYHGFLKTTFPNLSQAEINNDSTDSYLKNYMKSKGLYMTDGIGKTGRLFDLLVWKKQEDTTYSFKINDDLIQTKVVFMDSFITLGWEEYATLGKYYPGGWTSDAIYCVKSAYDLNSEDFLISLLAHEGRHYSDQKLFPKLKSADLEYRAKLTEISIANKTIYSLIDSFIDNANYESDNGHSIADYCVIRDLSNELFKVTFEKDKSHWRKIDVKTLNDTAYSILKKNTMELSAKGKGVEKFIKQ